MIRILLLLATVGMIFTACEPGGIDDDINNDPTEQPGGDNQGGEGNPDNPSEDDIPADKTQAIKFQDDNTKIRCTLHWDDNGDGELSYKEAAAVTDLGTAFKGFSILAFTELKYFTSLEKIANNAFEGCTNLITITLPKQLATIGASAFKGCTDLKNIAVPNAVTEIGNYAFQNCNNLTSVTIPDSVTKIGYCAFDGCTGELTVNCNIPSVPSGQYGTFYGSQFTKVTIGNSVTSIGSYAFENCTSLASVTIGYSVTSIGESAFGLCTSLTAFYGKFASADNRCLIVNGTLKAFAPAGLTSYTIFDSVTSIGKYTFYGCYSLTSITIPDSVTSIG